MAQKMLLELTTGAPERAAIKIDGATYELKCREDLGLREDAEFAELHEGFKATKDWKEMTAFLDRMVLGVVIGLPAETLAKLNDKKKLQIVQAFTTEVGARPATSLAAEAAGPVKEAAMAA